MRKYVCLIMLCAVVLCSCASVNEDKLYSFFQKDDVKFSYEDVTYSYSPFFREFQVENGSFKRMKIKYTDTNCSAEYEGFSIETNIFAFSHLAFFDMLWRAFVDAESDISISDNGAFVLIVDSSRFLVYYNKDNEYVNKIVAETDYGVFEYMFAETEEES